MFDISFTLNGDRIYALVDSFKEISSDAKNINFLNYNYDNMAELYDDILMQECEYRSACYYPSSIDVAMCGYKNMIGIYGLYIYIKGLPISVCCDDIYFNSKNNYVSPLLGVEEVVNMFCKYVQEDQYDKETV